MAHDHQVARIVAGRQRGVAHRFARGLEPDVVGRAQAGLGAAGDGLGELVVQARGGDHGAVAVELRFAEDVRQHRNIQVAGCDGEDLAPVFGELLEQRYAAAIEHGHADKDWTAIAIDVRAEAGLAGNAPSGIANLTFHPNDANTRSGFEHLYNLEYDQAVREFELALKAHPDDAFATNHLLSGDRAAIRRQTALLALQGLICRLPRAEAACVRDS